MAETGKKWACEYCTYENYQASKKCVLCRAQKRPQFINEEAPSRGSYESDIYKMTSICSQENLNQDNAQSSSSQQPDTSTAASKWACQTCTYLNWPRSQKCTQCLNPRPKVIPIMPTTHDCTNPLSISVNIENAAVLGANAKNSPRTSPRNSPNSPEAAKALNNDKNRAMHAQQSKPSTITPLGVKWSCKSCTYENWPKSPRCVLCGVVRARNSPTGIDNALTIASIGDLDFNNRSSSQNRASPPTLSRSLENIGGATASPNTHIDKQEKNRNEERKLRRFRSRLKESDWLWLNACQGIIEGDSTTVGAYIAAGGDTSRQLTNDECLFLNRPSAFQSGYTLVHLAIRFQHEDILAILLTATDVTSKARKCMPCHVAPDLAVDILRTVSRSLRQRKGDFPCYFLTECATFALPADVEDFPRSVQKQLFDEILDRDVQKVLEVVEPILNWSAELTERLASRMYALWNRTAGDCLLDSALQATWGVFDRDNALRRALADSLNEGAETFYPRWKETEAMHAHSLQFSLSEHQWQSDWAILLSLASQPGASLEQIHVFALAHILRRPIIVYGIKFVKSFRGENIGIARFQGVYLPLLWEPSFCWKDPIALGYTRGHFSALVPLEVDTDENCGAGAGHIGTSDPHQVVYYPLSDCDGKLLPVHYLTATELGQEDTMLRTWLNVVETEGGLLVAEVRIEKRPLPVRQMLDEWLDRYRRLAALVQSTDHHHNSPVHNLSSEEETDDE